MLVVEDELVQTEETTPEVSTLPEKFTGKSAEEIAESYVSLEKELGRKSNEVGELRRLTDQYLQQELSRTETDPKETDSLEFDDLVDDPTKSIESVVNPKLEAITKRLEVQDQERKMQEFTTNHPDYAEVGGSDAFVNWASASPYRSRQLAAAQSYDFEAASDLLATFKEQNDALIAAAEKGKATKRTEDLLGASAETSGTGEATTKIWSRAELLEMRKDRDKWDAMQPEIIKAYQENRVRT